MVDRLGASVRATWPDTATSRRHGNVPPGPCHGICPHASRIHALHASGCRGRRGYRPRGSAGAGKSTTAAALAVRGYAVLAEDVVALALRRGHLRQPAYPCIRLWPESVEALFGSGMRCRCSPNRTNATSISAESYRFQKDALRLTAPMCLAIDPEFSASDRGDTLRAALIALTGSSYVSHLRQGRTRTRIQSAQANRGQGARSACDSA
jgi:hypothetical protein